MKKRDGFENQIMLVIPPELYFNADNLTKQLYITAIGYFPKAEDHLVKRSGGCDSNILIICTGGSGWFENDGLRYEIKSGEAVIIPEDSPHRYGSADGQWWEIFWLHYHGRLAADVSSRISNSQLSSPFPLSPGDDSRRLFSEICSLLQEGISPLKYGLACSIFWHLTGSLGMDRSNGRGLTKGTIEECISLMEERIGSSLTLSELSRRVRVTPQYLCRLFKQKTGHSPIEHYTQLKMQRACSILDMTDDRISEISRQIGIDDPYYFTRIFKKIMGTSPRDFRNRQK